MTPEWFSLLYSRVALLMITR